MKNVAVTIRRCNLGAGIMILSAVLVGCGGAEVSKPLEAITELPNPFKAISELPNPFEVINKKFGGKLKTNKKQVFGVLTSDDPAAASVGNSILLNGGSAADAASAMAFTMSVTYPSRVGLGGGGVCLVGGGRGGEVKVLEFLPPKSQTKDRRTDRPSAVPAFVRGIAALHARHGRMPWRMVVAPARDFARDGVMITQSFSDDLEKYARPLFTDPASKAIFTFRDGKAYTVGNRLRQLDLNSVLSTIAGRGAGEFYNGLLARRLVEASLSAGGSLNAVELREYLPQWRDPLSVQIGENVVHTTPTPTTAGIVAIQMLQLAKTGQRDSSDTPVNRAHLMAEIAKRSIGERTKWLGRDLGASENLQTLLAASHTSQMMRTFSHKIASPAKKFVDHDRVPKETNANASFIVADGDGLIVNCSLTMYHPFGIGRTTPGLGIMLAAAPGGNGRNALPLGPIVVTRASDNATKFAFSGSSGATSATAMANVMIGVLLSKETLVNAVSKRRLHYDAANDEIVIEDRDKQDQFESLTALGHNVRRTSVIGRVNAISCPNGLPALEPSCNVVADSRSDGLATKVNFEKEVR